ncbi:MAG: hypothetical protein D3920_04975 [Candidatus Electrothrix sp. AW2]|nr:hypothetical protein [Candidatus Electrothrix gigas]
MPYQQNPLQTEKFDIEVAKKSVFVQQKEFEVQEVLFLLITENLWDDLSFINETTICEKIISPVLNIVAKKYDQLNVWSHVRDNFDEGWTQALAEMVASFLTGASLCYGVVTTGKTWEFGKLEHDTFTVDPVAVSAADNLQKTLNILNWMFERVAQLDV